MGQLFTRQRSFSPHSGHNVTHTVRAMASEFDGGANYREEKKAAAYEPGQMPAPGRRVRQPRAGRRAAPRRPMPANADWAGVVPPTSNKKFVQAPAKQEVCLHIAVCRCAVVTDACAGAGAGAWLAACGRGAEDDITNTETLRERR